MNLQLSYDELWNVMEHCYNDVNQSNTKVYFETSDGVLIPIGDVVVNETEETLVFKELA